MEGQRSIAATAVVRIQLYCTAGNIKTEGSILSTVPGNTESRSQRRTASLDS